MRAPISRHSVRTGLLCLAIISTVGYLSFSHLGVHERKNEIDNVAPADGQGMQAELEFSDLQMTAADPNGAVELRGRVFNAGNHLVTGAIVQLTFRNAAGGKLSKIQMPIQSTTAPPDPDVSDDFSGDSIEPDQSRPFRLVLSKTPARWDHKLPDINVITVFTNLE